MLKIGTKVVVYYNDSYAGDMGYSQYSVGLIGVVCEIRDPQLYVNFEGVGKLDFDLCGGGSWVKVKPSIHTLFNEDV